MDKRQTPAHLRLVAEAVDGFISAFRVFMAFHDSVNIRQHGFGPAVIPKAAVSAGQCDTMAHAVDLAAGRAQEASSLAEMKIEVPGFGQVDPITAWGTIRQPQPMLGSDDVFTGSNQIRGKLEQMILQAEIYVLPQVSAASMHPLVWSAAERLWRGEHYRQAVTNAAEALASHIKTLTGRNDVSETAIWQETFAEGAPLPGKPRLRWPGDPNARYVKTMNVGMRFFSSGAQMTIRNSAAHGVDEMSEQEAIERLATLSLLARWVDQCELHQ
ncbi:TIGR02391 family protein [Rhodococcus sp. 008]|uniref:TIGR02391 family protein n=1 Tax=Rhodococcus sp. 008 TaxID=1723645 RepID=UPI0008061C79|nr:TIGR02391 family protein [Rhodococcus sp. 008]ANQ74431.1 hypothetical protein AOT96_29155 [Rhodococcus sp. 008]